MKLELIEGGVFKIPGTKNHKNSKTFDCIKCAEFFQSKCEYLGWKTEIKDKTVEYYRD